MLQMKSRAWALSAAWWLERSQVCGFESIIRHSRRAKNFNFFSQTSDRFEQVYYLGNYYISRSLLQSQQLISTWHRFWKNDRISYFTGILPGENLSPWKSSSISYCRSCVLLNSPEMMRTSRSPLKSANSVEINNDGAMLKSPMAKKTSSSSGGVSNRVLPKIEAENKVTINPIFQFWILTFFIK